MNNDNPALTPAVEPVHVLPEAETGLSAKLKNTVYYVNTHKFVKIIILLCILAIIVFSTLMAYGLMDRSKRDTGDPIKPVDQGGISAFESEEQTENETTEVASPDEPEEEKKSNSETKTSTAPSTNSPTGSNSPSSPAPTNPTDPPPPPPPTITLKDDWLFMGDSITVWALCCGDDTVLINQVKTIRPSRNPTIRNEAIGGTSTQSNPNSTGGVDIIDGLLSSFDGSFVVLVYGTNDWPPGFAMNTLVDKVLAAGKIPVVPRTIWDNNLSGGNVAMIRDAIDQIYVNKPSVLRGPDLWTTFNGHPEWFYANDVHPNDDGRIVWRQTWANFIANTSLEQ